MVVFVISAIFDFCFVRVRSGGTREIVLGNYEPHLAFIAPDLVVRVHQCFAIGYVGGGVTIIIVEQVIQWTTQTLETIVHGVAIGALTRVELRYAFLLVDIGEVGHGLNILVNLGTNDA